MCLDGISYSRFFFKFMVFYKLMHIVIISSLFNDWRSKFFKIGPVYLFSISDISI